MICLQIYFLILLLSQQEIFGGKYISETWDSYGEIRGNVLQGNTFPTRGKILFTDLGLLFWFIIHRID